MISRTPPKVNPRTFSTAAKMRTKCKSLEHSKALTRAEADVLDAIITLQERNGFDWVEVSHAQIAKMAFVSVATVKRAIAKMVDLGFLLKQVMGGFWDSGFWKRLPNLYKIEFRTESAGKKRSATIAQNARVLTTPQGVITSEEGGAAALPSLSAAEPAEPVDPVIDACLEDVDQAVEQYAKRGYADEREDVERLRAAAQKAREIVTQQRASDWKSLDRLFATAGVLMSFASCGISDAFDGLCNVWRLRTG